RAEVTAAMDGRSSWTECCAIRRIRKLVPLGFKNEVKELSKLAAPMMAQFMSYAVSFVSTVFCGHLGKTELAGVSLAIATYGSGNLLRVGVILQRSILILLLTCFPCWAILINTEPILLAVKQEPEVASLAQMYVKIFMPALPVSIFYINYCSSFHGIIWPQVVTGLIVNLLNALINYIVLFLLKMGTAGSALANTLSEFSLAGFLYAYIMWKGLHKTTWGGWSIECLNDWKSYIHLAIPGMVMMCVEWWTYEIGGFLAGIYKVELGAQAVVFQLANIAYMFPMGFSIAGNVRVGNALGAGETEQAKLSAKATMFLSICMAVLIGSLKDHISYIFTYDEGAGKQRVGAICYFLGYYGIGFPIGIPLMFAAKQGIKGNIYKWNIVYLETFCHPCSSSIL
uniref:Solute carrier family 47 member 3 n=1 Tax=Cyprinodon variegatus TaxID=28743 RepID=A0A3Q2DB67_CYPVA